MKMKWKIIFFPCYINISLIKSGISHVNVNFILIMQFKETVTPVLAACIRPSLSAAAISPSRHCKYVMRDDVAQTLSVDFRQLEQEKGSAA